MWKQFPDVVRKIIESLCTSVEAVSLSLAGDSATYDEHVVISLLICLGEWAMRLPPECLVHTSTPNATPLLQLIFKVSLLPCY
jgi:hypothetical protein